ncbi:MAG: type IV pilin [Thermoplasmata archaeon]|nr:type IV pilin [Thermoplasmata archaeon]
MKANRKFVNGEEAVSAVIGVILMVAITVAIAATVYVWVTGFGGGGTPAPSMNVNQVSSASGGWVNFTIISASSDAKWNDLKVIVNGNELSFSSSAPTTNGTWGVYSGGSYLAQDTSVSAGQKLVIYDQNNVDAGNTLQIVHTPSNSIIVTKTIY